MRASSPLSHKSSRVIHSLLSFFIAFVLLLASSAAKAQESGTSAPAGEEAKASAGAPGSITGRVTSDDGRALGDIQVFLYGAYQGGPPRAVTTDAGGRFQFKELKGGLYTLRAGTPAFIEMLDESRSLWEPRYYRPGESAQLTLLKGGVITGTVMSPQGEPLTGATVRAIRVRDSQGRRVPTGAAGGGQIRMTDDRGIYRIYGLQPGSYLVVVGGGNPYIGMFNLYEADTPTYYPSSTRDTAAEVLVRAGEEATGVDVRYRAERGHTISGTVSSAGDSSGRLSLGVTLSRAGTGSFESQTYVADVGGKRIFSLNGVSDGEYEVVAQSYSERGEATASRPLRVTVRGSDVTGLQLALAPLASIAGRVTLEPLRDEACPKSALDTAMQQTLITARRDEKDKERLPAGPFYVSGNIPNEQGEFLIRNLSDGSFRLTVRPPADDWYVREITLPGTPPRPLPDKAKATDAQGRAMAPARAGTVSVKAGDKTSGITISLAQGAASLTGRVKAQTGGAAMPSNLRVHLVPAERERAEDQLRYAETSVNGDGSFNFNGLAPGRYWMVLREGATDGDSRLPPRMLAWDEDARKVLRREAETVNQGLELKPCQRLTDYGLGYTAR